jgi:DNA-binding response OmpR family regulator
MLACDLRSRTRPNTPARTRILVPIEDEALGRLVGLTLRHGPYDCRSTSGLEATRASMTGFTPHLMILDIDDADGRAIELISHSESDGRTPIAPTVLRRL